MFSVAPAKSSSCGPASLISPSPTCVSSVFVATEHVGPKSAAVVCVIRAVRQVTFIDTVAEAAFPLPSLMV